MPSTPTTPTEEADAPPTSPKKIARTPETDAPPEERLPRTPPPSPQPCSPAEKIPESRPESSMSQGDSSLAGVGPAIPESTPGSAGGTSSGTACTGDTRCEERPQEALEKETLGSIAQHVVSDTGVSAASGVFRSISRLAWRLSVAAGAPCDVFDPLHGCVGGGPVGSQSLSGAAGGVWKYGNLEIGNPGNPEIWKPGHLEPGNLKIWDPSKFNNENLQNMCRPKCWQGQD